uniref:SUEL-type lectin domain-containing protein n=1 Tax=viral metagenome TaxID=1070528 RepID=A0A6C0HEP8_9ZZZZ
MDSGIRELIIILLICVLVLYFTYYIRRRYRREGFASIVDPSVKSALGNEHSEFLEQSAEKYNPLMNLMNPSSNPLLSPDYSFDEAVSTQNSIRKALVSPSPRANDPSFVLKKSNVKDILINRNSIGTARRLIANAEKIKSANCGAFDNSEFAASAGICHEGGQDSKGNNVNGGLYISDDDKQNAQILAKRMNSKEVNYTPTVGKCDPYRFSTSKEQCITIQSELNCMKKQSFDVEGCGLCYQDNNFHYIEPTASYNPPSIQVAGSGSLSVGTSSLSKPIVITLNSNPQEIELPSLKEGDIIQLNVTPETSKISGYLIGQTPSGDFRIDIIRLIQVDTISGLKPRVSGSTEIDGENYTTIRPARGKESMSLALLNTFSFLDSSEYAAQKCGSGPYVKNPESLLFLNSSPCYKKGQVPGSYSLECLQQTFESAGCTSEGSGYPSNSSKAKELMIGPNGSSMKIGDIANSIYTKSILAYSGMDENGNKLPIPEWNKYTTFCTGKSINSPCDSMTPGKPLSVECLNYLWQNAGSTIKAVGPTYTNTINTTSLTSKNNIQFCTPNGEMAPIDSSGKNNDSAIAIARKQGSPENIKKFYDSIHKRANDNLLSDSERKDDVRNCYGINFLKPTPLLLKTWKLGPNSDVNPKISVPNSCIKSGGQDEVLDSYIYTINSSNGSIDFSYLSLSGRNFIGFTTKPDTGSWDAHEFIMYSSDIEQQTNIYESGKGPIYKSREGSLKANTLLRITYDGISLVEYYINDNLVRSVKRTSNTPLYGIISMKNTRSVVQVIKYIVGPPQLKKSCFKGCENDYITAQCPIDTKITGGSFRYGKWDNKTCGVTDRGTNVDISYPMPKQCIGKQSCTIRTDNNLYGDPYPGVFKQAELCPVCE